MVAINHLQPTVLLADLPGLRRDSGQVSGSGYDRTEAAPAAAAGRNEN